MALYINVVLNLPSPMYKLPPYAKTVHTGMEGNPNFPDPDPPLIILAEKTQALEKVLGEGTPAERLAAREALKEALRHERNYVQKRAETQAGTVDLFAIQALVESAGMSLRKVGAHPKAVFAAMYGPTEGSVDLTASASRKRDTHDWGVSTDQQNWSALPSTRQAKTRVTGLPAGVAHYFRHRLLTKDGPIEWSAPVMIVVK